MIVGLFVVANSYCYRIDLPQNRDDGIHWQVVEEDGASIQIVVLDELQNFWTNRSSLREKMGKAEVHYQSYCLGPDANQRTFDQMVIVPVSKRNLLLPININLLDFNIT